MRQNQIAAQVKVRPNDLNEKIAHRIEEHAIEGVKAQSEVNAIGLLTGYTMKQSDL